MKAMIGVYVLLVISGSVIGYGIGKHWYIPRRERRRLRRLNVMRSAYTARLVELQRERMAAMKNGRQPRIVPSGIQTGSGYDFEYDAFGDGGQVS